MQAVDVPNWLKARNLLLLRGRRLNMEQSPAQILKPCDTLDFTGDQWLLGGSNSDDDFKRAPEGGIKDDQSPT